jgi:hypothetical protein
MANIESREIRYSAAVDLYGAGRIAANPQEAGQLMDALLGDTAVLRDRFNAAGH